MDGRIGLKCERFGSLGVGVKVLGIGSLGWVGNILVVELEDTVGLEIEGVGSASLVDVGNGWV